MEELQPTKGKRITLPRQVVRYAVAYYTKNGGWTNMSEFHTTPEGAIEQYLRWCGWENMPVEYKPLYYTVYEIELEIPIFKIP